MPLVSEIPAKSLARDFTLNCPVLNDIDKLALLATLFNYLYQSLGSGLEDCVACAAIDITQAEEDYTSPAFREAISLLGDVNTQTVHKIIKGLL